MSLDPSWRLQEPAELEQVEKFSNAGTYLGVVAYGFHIAVYLFTMHTVWTSRIKRHAWLSTVFTTILFICASFNIIGNALAEQWAFIDYRNYPGGPAMFILEVGGIIWPNTLANIGAVLVTLVSDAVLLWRCYIVWGERITFIVVPVLMWVATAITGALTCYQAAQPAQSLNTLQTINFALSFWAIAITLNMLLTALISIRLLIARKHAIATLGHAHATTYTSVLAIIVESAAPYAILGFVWIVLYGIQNIGMFFILDLLVQVEAVAPELIILRIARGRAWTTTTNAELSELPYAQDGIRFAPASSDNTNTTYGSGRDGIAMIGLASKTSTSDMKQVV